MPIILLILIALLIWLFIEYRRSQKNLYAAQQIVQKIEDADKYAAEKRNEANRYDAEMRFEANKYDTAKRSDADKYAEEKRAKADAYYHDVKENTKSLESKRGALQEELQNLELDIFIGMVRIDDYENLKSDEIKNQLTLLRGKQDELIKNGSALKTTSNISTQKRIADNQKKQVLRCFNAECSNIIGSVTVKNVDASRAKIQRAFDTVNKLFTVDGVQISSDYLASKFEELSLVYAYMLKENEEREQRKAIREQMVEEEKVRREIERAKQKIEKEESQFTNEVNKLMGYLQKSKDDVERQLYMDKINDLQEKIKALEADKENVLQREQNTRAGFVYIISNIGAFGEHIYKIGMTRRLEPMDRIAELSSASVPFPFDVHALIFSDDAPGLETILHQHFSNERVNKVNPRKEFFCVDLAEIKKVVLENHNATVKFVDIPDATEYRETLKLNENA